MDDRLNASRNAVKQMLFYYMYAMTQMDIKDPKQIATAEIVELLNLSEEQVAYVLTSLQDKKVGKSLSYAIDLLDKTLKEDKLDKEAISISLKILKEIDKSAKDMIEKMSGGV